jgi:hypothetical protein
MYSKIRSTDGEVGRVMFLLVGLFQAKGRWMESEI